MGRKFFILMKPIVLYSSKFLSSISIFMTIAGISLFPFIILREKYRDGGEWWVNRGKRTINHETIHFFQQLELLVIGFYIMYVLFYLINVIKYKFNMQKAYYAIPFEKEAYNNQDDFEYLSKRKLFIWIKYIF